MLIPYWTYSIQKNWNGRISREIADTNILCYGKHNTNKTHIIGRSCLLRAVEEGRSALLYAEDIEEYEDILEHAAEMGIDIFDLDANEDLDDNDLAFTGEICITPYEQKNICIQQIFLKVKNKLANTNISWSKLSGLRNGAGFSLYKNTTGSAGGSKKL